MGVTPPEAFRSSRNPHAWVEPEFQRRLSHARGTIHRAYQCRRCGMKIRQTWPILPWGGCSALPIPCAPPLPRWEALPLPAAAMAPSPDSLPRVNL